MRATELSHGQGPVRAQRGRSRRVLTWWLALAVIALAACGGSSQKKTASVTQSTPTAPAIASATASATTPSAATKPKRKQPTAAAKPKAPATTSSATTPTTRSAGTPVRRASANGTAVDPAREYPTVPGPQPLDCLLSAGLNRARKAKEFGVWEANAGATNSNDPNGKVFVDGPHRSGSAASAAAHSLQGVEYAASGGRWEVSASLPSHLSAVVATVAKCLAGPGARKSNSYTF